MSDAQKERLKAAAKAAAARKTRVGTLKGGGGDPLGLGTLFGVPVTFIGIGAIALIGFAIWRRSRA